MTFGPVGHLTLHTNLIKNKPLAFFTAGLGGGLET